MQRLGQHFLLDSAELQKIAHAVDMQPGDTIVEIGPGHGELTRYLLQRCKEKRCRLVTIEKDRILAEKLRAGSESLEILTGDALKMLPESVARASSGVYKIVGNIPYYITGKLLRLIGELEPKPTRCVFTLQKEVALRLSAGPPRMNKLAASVQFWAEPTIVGFIPRDAFRPAPKVDAAILALHTKPARAGAERYYQAVRLLFAHPRKTILNNLGEALDRTALSGKLKAIGIQPEDRPQNLGIEEIIRISKLLGASC